MLGCYYSDKNEIILYTCTICNCCTKNRIDFDEEIISVLAHELFHAIHYFAISDFQISPSTKFWGSKNNNYKTVIESLARYFEYTWCIKNKYNDIKNGLIREANTTRFPGWPYAGAKIFMHCDNYAFEDIFHISVRFGWSDAYDELIDIGRHKGIYS